jgi:uncharacterized protein YqeY
MRTVDEWKATLRTALRDAQRSRDTTAVAVLRETLATIDNAEAPDLSNAPAPGSTAIAGAVQGLGAGDIARRVLAPDEVASIVEREVRERRSTAATYVSLGRTVEAAQLEQQASILDALVVTS